MRSYAGCLILATLFNLAFGQTQSPTHQPSEDEHGTCATTVLAPFGAAFVIDSRITVERNNVIVRQFPGCKVLLARPTVLLAGVGLEDTTGRAGHWNSLDEASALLKQLPDNPSVEQLDQWSDLWFRSLVKHYRAGKETPANTGVLAEILLITRVGNEPYFRRTTVTWDGFHFDGWTAGQNRDRQSPYVNYSGACRVFVVHNNEIGRLVPPKFPRTLTERIRLAEIGDRKIAAKTVSDLANVAYDFETVLTDIDKRLQGEQAVIAPPYATAEWAEGAKGWTTHFNSECGPVAPKGH